MFCLRSVGCLTILLVSLSACASDSQVSSQQATSTLATSTTLKVVTYPTFPNQQFSEIVDFARQQGGADVNTVIGDRFPEMIVWFEFGVSAERIDELMSSYRAQFREADWSFQQLKVPSEELSRIVGELAQKSKGTASFDYRKSAIVVSFSSEVPQGDRGLPEIINAYPVEIGPDSEVILDGPVDGTTLDLAP